MATRTTTQFFVPPSAFASTPHPVTAHGSRIRYADSHVAWTVSPVCGTSRWATATAAWPMPFTTP